MPGKPKRREYRLYSALMYPGAIPFLGLSMLLLFEVEQILGIETLQALASYGLLIISFMAGTLWPSGLSQGAEGTKRLFISNIIAISAWFSFLFGHYTLIFAVYVACFLVLLRLDFGLARCGVLSFAYTRDRACVTGLVVCSLLVPIAIEF